MLVDIYIYIRTKCGSIYRYYYRYGVIDIVLGKIVDAKFLGVDVNRRALHLAEMNKKENNLSNIIDNNIYVFR